MKSTKIKKKLKITKTKLENYQKVTENYQNEKIEKLPIVTENYQKLS